MKKKTNTALLLIVVIGIAILIGSLAIMLPGIEDGPEDTDRAPIVTTDPTSPGDPEDPEEPEDTVKNNYTITIECSGGTYAWADGIDDNVAYLYGKRVIEFVPESCYRQPDNVLVIGASSTWYKGTGYLEIYNATSDVTVIYEPVQTFKVYFYADNCMVDAGQATVDYGGKASFTVIPDKGYKFDKINNLTWTGSCTSVDYNESTHILTVGGITSETRFYITPEYIKRTLQFENDKYFSIVKNFEGIADFSGDWSYSFTLIPVDGYKITNVTFEGITPSSYRTEYMVDGKNVGAWFEINHSDSQTSYDFKVNVTVTKLPQTYNVVFENSEYFTVHDYSSKDGSIGYYTFQGSYKYCWTFAPIDGYKIGMIKVEGLTPKAEYINYPINGEKIGGYLELSGLTRPTGDIKITVIPEKLPTSAADTHTLKFHDTLYGYTDCDVESLTFGAGDTVKFIVYHSDRNYDCIQFYNASEEAWITDGADYSVIGGYGFSIVTITFANDDSFYSYFGSGGDIEFCFSTIAGPDTSSGFVIFDAQCNGGGGVGAAEPWQISPGDTALIPCYPDEDGMAIDGWSCNISETYWEADFIVVNGNLYVLFTLGEDYPVENSSEIQFYVWFA